MRPDDLNSLRARKLELIQLLERVQLPLYPRAVSDPVPLIDSQLPAWAGYAMQEGAHERFCAFAIGVSGPLNIELLRECLTELVRRHEPLRTRILVENGEPRQFIDQPSGCSFDVVDVVTTNSQGDKNQDIQRYICEFIGQKIEFSVGPLFAARLLRFSRYEYVLIMSLDHLITDGVTNGILNREIWALYKNRAHGQPFSLPEVALQFADYAVSVGKMRLGWLQKHAPYWKARLADVPRLQFPLDCHARETSAAAANLLNIQFGEPLNAELLKFARQERVFAALVMLAVHVSVIARWCNEKELVLMFVDHGRYRPELVNMVGYLASHLYLRIDVSKAKTFLDLLALVNREYQAACYHRDFNWAPAQVAKFETCLYFNWVVTDGLDWPSTESNESGNLKLRVLPIDWQWLRQAPQPDDDLRKLVDCDSEMHRIKSLSIFFSQAADELHATVICASDRPAPTALEQFSRNLRTFTEIFIRRPMTSIDSVSFDMG